MTDPLEPRRIGLRRIRRVSRTLAGTLMCAGGALLLLQAYLDA